MTICPCDRISPPALRPIAPGLGRLPRQIGLFGDFRADLLARIRSHPELALWRGRDAEDFGLMLLEFWAYVSDVVAFYTSEHAQDLYLPTARDAWSLARIVTLIDHIPRPAVATEAVLAALLDGSDIVTAPKGAGFLSDATDDVPPQHFELTAATALDPLRNGWALQPLRDLAFRPDTLLIDPASRNLAEGAILVIDAGASWRKVTRATRIVPETALDNGSYLRLEIADPAALPGAGLTVDEVRLWSFAQSVPVATISGTAISLAGHYPQLRDGEPVVIEDMRLDSPAAPELQLLGAPALGFGNPVTSGTGSGAVTVPGPPVTTATLSGASAIAAANARLHFGRVRAGRLAAPLKPVVTGNDLLAGLWLKTPAPAPKLAGADEVLLKGVADSGLRVPGLMEIDADTGRGRLAPSSRFHGGPEALQAPVVAHGNLLAVTRGKTVEEVLGSGQGPGVPFQTFNLTKSPLTYLHDATAPGGRRSTLRLWIDGIEWKEVRSLFTAGPDDRVFTVRLNPEGKATLTTGGEGFGQPAPLGVRNVFATYRFGAGEPAPGANRIRQVAGPVAGLRRVFNVTSAFGGAPADTPADIRFTAPTSAAAFDRAISASDHVALARDWGVLAARAVTEWVPEALCEGVVVTAIFASPAAPEDLESLLAHLRSRAAEATPIRVVAAISVAGMLKLSLRSAAGFAPDKVHAAIKAALLDPFTGLLSPRRAEIGGPIFRSAILGAIAQVPGVGTLLSLTLDNVAMPVRLNLPAQGYLAPDLTIEEVPE